MGQILKIDKLKKTFTNHHLGKVINPLDGISFDLDQGDFLGIVGRSGSGKSTIIKCIYRSYLTSSGDIFYESQAFGRVNLSDLEERKMIYLRKFEIGYVSQFLDVMPRITCLDLVINSLLETGETYERARDQARATLRHFGLAENLWDSYPNTFSGGEKLRLNISMAIVKKPRLLLLDEPTASLDNSSKIRVREAIEKLKLEGTTMVGIFHDLEFMEGLTDCIYHMNTREMERL